MKFIGDTLGANLLGECLSDLSRSFYKSHFGLPFWDLFFWKVFGLPFWEPLFWTVFGLTFWEPLFLESLLHKFT